MYQISKEFHFSASHSLNGLPENHPCSRIHGHNYVIEVILLSDKLTNEGFVIDYRELKPIKEWLDGTFDHRHLNDILPINPTAENIAKFIYDRWKDYYPLYGVKVKETPKTEATYYASKKHH